MSQTLGDLEAQSSGDRTPSKANSAPSNMQDAIEKQSGNKNYEQFCRRVGIWPLTPYVTPDGIPGRPAQNQGVYQQVVRAQRTARTEYYASATGINVALFSQIIIAAAVTALSASSGPRVVLTVLGALNTVIAGSLTYIKGQGLPDRLSTYADELRRVREHIEDLERCYEQDPCFKLDVDAEAKHIYDMYNKARESAEKADQGTFKKKVVRDPKAKSNPFKDGGTPSVAGPSKLQI